MVQKKPFIKQQVRNIKDSFSWIPHNFLHDGFLSSLILVLTAGRQGLSYYSFDKICSLPAITPDDYINAKNGLIKKDPIAFDGYLFQVLSLPKKLVSFRPQPITNLKEMEERDPAIVHQLIRKSLENEGKL